MSAINYWVDIEDNAGNRFGAGPLRPRTFTSGSLLSASGEFSFEISSTDPNLSALQEKRVAICRYIASDGTIKMMGGGVIDKINIQISNEGSLVYEVSGNDLSRELTYRSVGRLALESNSAGVTNAPGLIMALAPTGWTIQNGFTQTAVYAGFDGESVLNALIRCGEHIGEHWRLGDGRQVVWLGVASTFSSSGLRAVQHINDAIAVENADSVAVIISLKEISDAADLVTRIYPRGSGNGSAILTLAAANESAPAGFTLDKANNCLINSTAEALYGRIDREIDFKELGPLSNTALDLQNAASMLLKASLEYLKRHAAPVKFYEVELANVNQVLQPGTTLRIVYRKIIEGVVVYDLDDRYNIIGAEQMIDESGLRTVRVEISTIDRQPVSDADYLAGQMQSARVVSTYPQLGVSVDNLSWRDEMDKDNAASFRFWLGDEYTSVQRALLRFRIQPLRSTVKSVSSGGGSSQTSSSGGGGSQTSSASVGNTDVTYLGSVPGSHLHGAGSHTHNVTIFSHTHLVDVPSHTHNQVYGIYQESSGNTLALSDLVIKLNGGSDLRGQVVDIGNGWYALDFTNGLVDDIFRPAREDNVTVISTATSGKTARLEAQLTLRGVVQAIAYE